MEIKRFIKSIPYWAYLLVLLSIVTNTLYFIFKQQEGIDYQSNHWENGLFIIDYVTPGGAAEKAGIRPGDILVTVDSMDVIEWSSIYRGTKAGDTSFYGIIRGGQKMELPVVFSSMLEFNFGFLFAIYIILILLSIGGLYLLYKKPHDVPVRLFFIFLQFFVVTQNANYLTLREPLAIAATFIFLLSSCLVGPILIHFHLLFPRPAKFYKRFGKWKAVFYVVGTLVTLWWFMAYKNMVINELEVYTSRIITRLSLLWMISTYFLAVAIVIFQFISIKETFSRNQLRLVITGSFFGIYTAIPIVFFDGWVQQIQAKYPYIMFNLQGIGSLIMIGCILIAIFRYRIWDIEIFFRKTLLYIGATVIIIFSYLFLIFLINQLAINETNITRFLILAISVIIFLILRDGFQRLIDRIFHRESYGAATVVSNFEEKLAGIYRTDELKIKIAQSLDDIFHFKAFMFNLTCIIHKMETLC
ncbi:MAG: PDZ domain-containing protein [Bacteroidetes bacterium]|nr:PDZ domain-containing protein [Bacteroidota bacterium]